MKKIFIIGGTTYDHIVTLNEFPAPTPQTIHEAPFYETTGSTGSGKALCLKKLDVPSVLYSTLGKDIYGEKIIQHLKQEEVDFIYDFDPKGTERHFNIMDSEGNRISIFITQASEKPKISLGRIKDLLNKCDVIVLNIISYCKEIIPIIPKNLKPIWTDLHDYNEGNEYHEPFIEVSDYIFLSSDNLKNYKQTMEWLINRGKELVVCTHGKNGASALTKDGSWIEQPAIEGIEQVDTNGAGDNFFSGFLYAFYKNKSLADCMKYSSICGAECVTSQQLVSHNLSPHFLENYFNTHYK